ncbi:hypothetical protein FC34_GL001877 [Lacticaseibacillus brantae DSM 23927]|uniref:Manganese transport regulator n=1 Tax=Lacticaseibacillus brantae DSM 23927 TaxID=1423727 RepID=A0A0R2AXJ6_9LACO|nr:hypothetical protein FC34_GL001877 [Lacticaseibacillus brantae DSM 23927]
MYEYSLVTGFAHNKQLAESLDVAPASVTEKIKRLVSGGLIKRHPYGQISLTPQGAAQVKRLMRNYYLIEVWLVNSIHYPKANVADLAWQMADIDDCLAEMLYTQLGEPNKSPFLEPIVC